MVPRLVDSSWLAERLGDPAVVAVEVDSDAGTYYQGHIPGAVFLDRLDELQEPYRRAFVGRAGFQALMSRKGIGPDHHVVLYGDAANCWAANAYWLFRYYGHARLSLLDGGRDIWRTVGRALTDDEVSRAATRYRSGGAHREIRASRDDVLHRLTERLAGTAVLDRRSPQEFAGFPGDVLDLPLERHRVNGHIPGATNLPASSLLDPAGRLLPLEDLREIFAEHVEPGQEVIVHCRVGERSGLVWFALRELLQHPAPVRLYDGGWAEYGSLVDVPVSRGAPAAGT